MIEDEEPNYKEELANQIERTKEMISILERSAKQFNTLWYLAIYMAILLSIMLIKQIWW